MTNKADQIEDMGFPSLANILRMENKETGWQQILIKNSCKCECYGNEPDGFRVVSVFDVIDDLEEEIRRQRLEAKIEVLEWTIRNDYCRGTKLRPILIEKLKELKSQL